MQDSFGEIFLTYWHDAMEVLSIVFFVLGFVVYFIYTTNVSRISGYKKKYDYVVSNEIKWYKRIFFFFALSVAMLINMYAADTVTKMGAWFFVRAAFSVAGATLVGYVGSLMMDYYYPNRLYKRLKKYRYAQRTNSNTGNKMRLYGKHDDYVHLSMKNKPKNGVHSMDFDIWVDEQFGDIKIEEYDSRKIYSLCRSCWFYTMRVVDEEIITAEENEMEEYGELNPQQDELLRHYKCSYCKSMRATQFYISTKTEEDYKKEQISFAEEADDGIYSVRVEMHSTSFDNEKELHDFRTISQALKFLEDYQASARKKHVE